MDKNWTLNERGRRAAQELLPQLPVKIFDIHAHIYRTQDLKAAGDSLWAEGPKEVPIREWRAGWEEVVGGERLAGGLFFPVPMLAADLRSQNDYIVSQLEKEPSSRGLIIVTPDDNLQQIAAYLEHPQIAGFKVYHIYSNEKPTWGSSIRGFCPEWVWQEADRRGMVIMLHMVKDRAIADPDNVREIRDMCTQYPHAKLILAHAARCFHAPNAKGISALRGLENVYFDSSAVCEPEALKVILQQFGPRKLMWGSDYPVSQIRGKSVTVGDGFVWLEPGFGKWDQTAHLGRPILAGIESLRALLTAAADVGLNEQDLEHIFYCNAARLLRLEPEPRNATQELYAHAKKRIPGGVQLLSKRPENMAPGKWPAYFREARGCEVWDMDGVRYYDMSTTRRILPAWISRPRCDPGRRPQSEYGKHVLSEPAGGSRVGRYAVRASPLGRSSPFH
ncbi:amidohydrolase family protein [Gordoniibacillus kamchatkensis]|uniref:amidohydrolase family protein n=1 Tax=Gordoniibacillus kamchatkensis TaxID=1590651 RepID=UPI0018CE8047|nr:amidohydrolase family protein [Paenibacillus sp. VKM B-2647]